MPITVPPYVAYQAPLFPLRGLWNHAPAEGDRMVQAEIDWLVTAGPGNAVQFQLSGNSPVAFSQIVSIWCDNSASAVDVQFMFPDSGYVLVVPAYAQVVSPVFTNALTFYCFAPGAVGGDRTLFMVFNSVPPPVAIQRSEAQEVAASAGILLNTAGTTSIIPAGVSGTVEGISMTVDTGASAAGTAANIYLRDGNGNTIWSGVATSAGGHAYINLTPVSLPFVNGLSLVVGAGPTLTTGFIVVNVYYGVP